MECYLSPIHENFAAQKFGAIYGNTFPPGNTWQLLLRLHGPQSTCGALRILLYLGETVSMGGIYLETITTPLYSFPLDSTGACLY